VVLLRALLAQARHSCAQLNWPPSPDQGLAVALALSVVGNPICLIAIFVYRAARRGAQRGDCEASVAGRAVARHDMMPKLQARSPRPIRCRGGGADWLPKTSTERIPVVDGNARRSGVGTRGDISGTEGSACPNAKVVDA